MLNSEVNVVTGVSGFTGKYIAQRLLSKGKKVINLTGHPDRPTDFGDAVESIPYNFDNPTRLTESLKGAKVLYNTYWIRFESGNMTFDKAVANSRILISAAKSAGVSRIVHISIANPSEESPQPYYRGKALVEKAIQESGLSFAIIRPALLFGNQGALINNIAWFLRHMPIFAIPGNGEYRLQPIFVEDLADLAVDAGSTSENLTFDAVGPEMYTLNDLVYLIKQTVHSKTLIIHLNPLLALATTAILGFVLRDVVLTRDELESLKANLLVSNEPPKGKTKLSEWLLENKNWIGTYYISELKKHFS